MNIYFLLTQSQKCVVWFFLTDFAKRWLWNLGTFHPKTVLAGSHGLQGSCGEAERREIHKRFYFLWPVLEVVYIPPTYISLLSLTWSLTSVLWAWACSSCVSQKTWKGGCALGPFPSLLRRKMAHCGTHLACSGDTRLTVLRRLWHQVLDERDYPVPSTTFLKKCFYPYKFIFYFPFKAFILYWSRVNL